MGDKKGLFSFLNFDSIIDNLSGYVEKRLALFKIEMKEDLAGVGAKLVIVLVLSLSLFMIIMFLSIACAMLLNNILGSESLGFFIVAGFYFIIFLGFLLLKDQSRFEVKLKNIFLEMFNNDKDENGNE